MRFADLGHHLLDNLAVSYLQVHSRIGGSPGSHRLGKLVAREAADRHNVERCAYALGQAAGDGGHHPPSRGTVGSDEDAADRRPVGRHEQTRQPAPAYDRVRRSSEQPVLRLVRLPAEDDEIRPAEFHVPRDLNAWAPVGNLDARLARLGPGLGQPPRQLVERRVRRLGGTREGASGHSTA
jgi:hypothetical protein